MHTSNNEEDRQPLACAWALLDGGEYLARQAAQTETDSSLWLLAANSILRARDALEAIYPSAAQKGGHESLPDGTCQDLVQAAARQLRSIRKVRRRRDSLWSWAIWPRPNRKSVGGSVRDLPQRGGVAAGCIPRGPLHTVGDHRPGWPGTRGGLARLRCPGPRRTRGGAAERSGNSAADRSRRGTPASSEPVGAAC